MKKIADVLQAWLHSVSYLELVFLKIELFDELLPIYEGFGFESTIVEEKIDLFWSQGDIEISKGFFEHEVSDSAWLFFVDFWKGLLESLGAAGEDVLHVIDLNGIWITNLLHWSSIFSF